jgi:hypothetical protein
MNCLFLKIFLRVLSVGTPSLIAMVHFKTTSKVLKTHGTNGMVCGRIAYLPGVCRGNKKNCDTQAKLI